MIYSLIIGILVFIIYNAIAIKKFGIPPSLSDTFYLYLNEKKGLGFVFTGMMFTLAFCMMPSWIAVTELISSWSGYLTVLPFLGAGCIAAVGSAPAFRGVTMENKVHMICAKSAAVFSLLWCCVVCYKIAYILPAVLLIFAAIAHGTKTAKSGRDYWLEMVAFFTTFITVLIETIILL